MDKICLCCIRLQRSMRYATRQNLKLRNPTTLKNAIPSIIISRDYSIKERSSEQKYRHGKLIVEEEEDPLLYPKLLITLSGRDEAVLENYSYFVKKAAKMTDVNVSKSFNMPAHEESYKAKRDGEGLQKEMEYRFKQFQRIIEVTDLTADKSDIFLEFAQKSLPAGVQMKLESQRWEMLVDPNHISLRDPNN